MGLNQFYSHKTAPLYSDETPNATTVQMEITQDAK